MGIQPTKLSSYIDENGDEITYSTPRHLDSAGFHLDYMGLRIPETPATSRNITSRIHLFRSTLTQVSCDAVVNGIDVKLMGYDDNNHYNDSMIMKAAGPLLVRAMEKFGGCATSQVVSTPAYNMKNCKNIIHVSVPMCGRTALGMGPDDRIYKVITSPDPMKLTAAYYNVLDEARRIGARTIVIPCIGRGRRFGYSIGSSAHIACRTIKTYLQMLELISAKVPVSSFDNIILCVRTNDELEIYKEVMGYHFTF